MSTEQQKKLIEIRKKKQELLLEIQVSKNYRCACSSVTNYQEACILCALHIGRKYLLLTVFRFASNEDEVQSHYRKKTINSNASKHSYFIWRGAG